AKIIRRAAGPDFATAAVARDAAVVLPRRKPWRVKAGGVLRVEAQPQRKRPRIDGLRPAKFDAVRVDSPVVARLRVIELQRAVRGSEVARVARVKGELPACVGTLFEKGAQDAVAARWRRKHDRDGLVEIFHEAAAASQRQAGVEGRHGVQHLRESGVYAAI